MSNCYKKVFIFCVCLSLAVAAILTVLWHLSNYKAIKDFNTSHRVKKFLELINGTLENSKQDDVDTLYFYNIDELASTNGVAQDDPFIIKYAKNNFLVPPVPKSNSYNLASPAVEDPSMGQSEAVRKILKNKKNGFFVECGALDGETRSNTLYMERFLGWSGLLIEADPSNFQLMTQKLRSAWTAPTCLSVKPSPHLVTYMQHFNIGKISDSNITVNKSTISQKPNHVMIQCMPITTLLLALNRTQVDYFSLDVEGDELEVLKTIDFDVINIKTLSVEYIHGKEGKGRLKQYMESKGYDVKGEITNEWGLANDYIFVKRNKK